MNTFCIYVHFCLVFSIWLLKKNRNIKLKKSVRTLLWLKFKVRGGALRWTMVGTCHSHCGQRSREKPWLWHSGQSDLISYAGNKAPDLQVTLVSRYSELLRLQQPAGVCHHYEKMAESPARGRYIFLRLVLVLLLLLLHLPRHTEAVGRYVGYGQVFHFRQRCWRGREQGGGFVIFMKERDVGKDSIRSIMWAVIAKANHQIWCSQIWQVYQEHWQNLWRPLHRGGGGFCLQKLCSLNKNH